MAGAWVLAAGVALVCLAYSAEIRSAAQSFVGVSGARQAADAGARSRTPAQERTAGPRVVELRANYQGHYYTSAEIDGRRVNVLVDTGATMVALTYEDARTIGLSIRDSDFTHRVSTANGFGRVAPVTIDRISIGDVTVRNVRAAVMEPGKLGTTLLGMTFLGRLQRVDMRAGSLVLQE
jgi:aspartyl protease family protein